MGGFAAHESLSVKRYGDATKETTMSRRKKLWMAILDNGRGYCDMANTVAGAIRTARAKVSDFGMDTALPGAMQSLDFCSWG
jgi:hypothetical protein